MRSLLHQCTAVSISILAFCPAFYRVFLPSSQYCGVSIMCQHYVLQFYRVFLPSTKLACQHFVPVILQGVFTIQSISMLTFCRVFFTKQSILVLFPSCQLLDPAILHGVFTTQSALWCFHQTLILSLQFIECFQHPVNVVSISMLAFFPAVKKYKQYASIMSLQFYRVFLP